MKNQTESNITRRKSLGLLGGLSMGTMFSLCDQSQGNNQLQKDPVVGKLDYNLNDPKDKLLIFEKLTGDLSGRLAYSFSKGRVFGIRPDLNDDLNGFGKEVFRFTGCRISRKRVLENGNVENKSRSWLLYQDPITEEYLNEMTNPYTGEVVEVPPFRGGIRGGIMTPNGPEVDANFKMESTAFNAPLNLVFNIIGNRIHLTRHAFTKWFEKKSQTYRTEMTLDTYDFDAKYLEDRTLQHIPSDSHWTSQTAWLSLLKMADSPGHMIWSTNGNCLFDKNELPKDFVTATAEKQPNIFSEPLEFDD